MQLMLALDAFDTAGMLQYVLRLVNVIFAVLHGGEDKVVLPLWPVAVADCCAPLWAVLADVSCVGFAPAS